MTSPSSLAGALASSSPALAGLTFVDAGGNALLFGGGLSASVDGTLALSGAGLSSAEWTLAQEAAFVAGVGAFLGVSPGGVCHRCMFWRSWQLTRQRAFEDVSGPSGGGELGVFW